MGYSATNSKVKRTEKNGKKLHKILPEGKLQGELLPAAPLQPCAGPCQGGDIRSLTGFTWPHVIIPATVSFLLYRHGAPLGMAPCAEAPHLEGFIRLVGFYPSLASRIPAHYCPLLRIVSSLRAITLTYGKLRFLNKSDALFCSDFGKLSFLFTQLG